MADEDGPRPGVGVVVGRRAGRSRAGGRGEVAEHAGEGGADPRVHLGERLAARRMDADRVAPPAGDLDRVALLDLALEEALPRALGDLGEPRLGPQRRHGTAGGGERGDDRLGRLARPGQRRVDDRRRARPAGTGRRGGASGAASRAPASAAWRRPSGERGVSERALEATLREPDGLAVAEEDERRREVRRDGQGGGRGADGGPATALPGRPSSGRLEVDDPLVEDAVDRPQRRLGLGRDRVVEGQEHHRVAARRASGPGASR